MIKAAAAAAPKFNLGGDGGSHHPFQEAVIESTQPRFATPPQAPAEVGTPPSYNTIQYNTIANNNFTSRLAGLKFNVRPLPTEHLVSSILTVFNSLYRLLSRSQEEHRQLKRFPPLC